MTRCDFPSGYAAMRWLRSGNTRSEYKSFSISSCGSGMLKYRQTERGLRYKRIARNGDKARAGALARPFVVPGNDHALARGFNQNLSTAQNVSGRIERYTHVP